MTKSEFINKYEGLIEPEIMERLLSDFFPADPYQCDHSWVKQEGMSATKNVCERCNEVKYIRDFSN